MPTWFGCVILGACMAIAPPACCDEELRATTEFGFTVAPDEVYEAIEETADFWPPVRKHVAGPEFAVADPAVRQQAAAFIATVNQALHDRLFGDDEAAAEDLIEYLRARLRITACYRQLRSVLDDDAVLASTKSAWESGCRDASRSGGKLPVAEAALSAELRKAGSPVERISAAEPIVQALVGCTARRDSTDAGQMMLNFERQVVAGDRATAEVIRGVVAAADWALIVKPSGTKVTKPEFVAAWAALDGFRRQNVAVAPVALGR